MRKQYLARLSEEFKNNKISEKVKILDEQWAKKGQREEVMIREI